MEDGRGGGATRLKDRFLIDECLSGELVVTAKARGYDADYIPHLGKAGWQDWNLVRYAVDHDYIVVADMAMIAHTLKCFDSFRFCP